MPKRPFLISTILLLALTSYHTLGQSKVINTLAIEKLVEEWNNIHNERQTKAFTNVYGGALLFYAKDVSRTKAINDKKRMFRNRPEFRQRIVNDIAYTIYNDGIIKCDFIKETKIGDKWRTFPSYLLIKSEERGYRIVGESDYATDKRANFTLQLGAPMVMEITPKSTVPTATDSVPVQAMKLPTELASAAKDMISVPREDVFMLMGLIAGCGFLIFVSDAIHQRRQRRQAQQANVGPDDYGQTIAITADDVVAVSAPRPMREESQQPAAAPGEAFIDIENRLKQSAFRDYVVAHLESLRFSYLKPKSARDRDGEPLYNDAGPVLEFQVQDSDGSLRNFGIQSLYREDTSDPLIHLFSKDTLRFNRQFHKEVDLYYLVGLGGPPDKPNQMFLIPGADMHSTALPREKMQAFRKSGMFVYNRGKLQ